MLIWWSGQNHQSQRKIIIKYVHVLCVPCSMRAFFMRSYYYRSAGSREQSMSCKIMHPLIGFDNTIVQLPLNWFKGSLFLSAHLFEPHSSAPSPSISITHMSISHAIPNCYMFVTPLGSLIPSKEPRSNKNNNWRRSSLVDHTQVCGLVFMSRRCVKVRWEMFWDRIEENHHHRVVWMYEYMGKTIGWDNQKSR
jgi:hypothetical protein